MVFRENTEGLYVGVGGRFKPGTEDEIAIQEEVNTWKGVHRIVRHAFEFARARGLTKVCMTDKSNAMTHGHALWQRVFKDIAPEYPGIEATHYYVDALAMFMVLDPGQFQVIVTNNLFGDIVTDLGAALQGGSGWRLQEISIRAGPRCSSRSTALPRSSPERTSPIPSAPSSRPR